MEGPHQPTGEDILAWETRAETCDCLHGGDGKAGAPVSNPPPSLQCGADPLDGCSLGPGPRGVYSSQLHVRVAGMDDEGWEQKNPGIKEVQDLRWWQERVGCVPVR